MIPLFKYMQEFSPDNISEDIELLKNYGENNGNNKCD
tara:strand:+ start:846 stop:956 length:111 start_codon:yes stop_codon:yes gene_type:complete